MNAESLKLGIIERLIKVQNKATLQELDNLITKAEIEANAEESLESLNNGDVVSLEEFKLENRKWVKKNYMK
jgi:hypothetical protein